MHELFTKYLYLCPIVANKFVQRFGGDIDDTTQMSMLALLYSINKWDYKKQKTATFHFFAQRVMYQYLMRNHFKNKEKIRYSKVPMQLEIVSLQKLQEELGYEPVQEVEKKEGIDDFGLEVLQRVISTIGLESYNMLLDLYSYGDSISEDEWIQFSKKYSTHDGIFKKMLQNGKYKKSKFRSLALDSVKDKIKFCILKRRYENER